MNKRANRVYWLLLIMMLIFGFSMAIDGIRADKHKNNQVKNTDGQVITEITTVESTTEISSENIESTEVTTLSDEAAKLKINNFYSGQVFMGDSIMSGFATYTSTKEAPEWLNNVIFLSKVSWGISSVLGDNNGPMYQGKSRNIRESLSMINPQRIFINLGINEMNGLGSPGYSIDKLIGKYGELITGVKEAAPNSKIYIINITPCTEERETPMFSNTVIKEFDKALEESTKTWGVTYLDLASEFGDVLEPELSSDNFVHHNNKAYSEKWVPFLENVALNDN